MMGFGRLIGASILAIVLLATRGQAMEGMDMSGSNNTCPLMAGMHEMHLSAYQNGSIDELCMDIPATGPVTISIDAVSPELRDMTTEIRVVKGTGTEASGNLDQSTIAYVAPKRYPAGTATFPVTFNDTGKYAVLVTVRDDHGMVMSTSFPLTVGAILSPGLIVGVIFGLALIVALVVYLRAVNRQAAAVKTS
jgi:hypothetical protein